MRLDVVFVSCVLVVGACNNAGTQASPLAGASGGSAAATANGSAGAATSGMATAGTTSAAAAGSSAPVTSAGTGAQSGQSAGNAAASVPTAGTGAAAGTSGESGAAGQAAAGSTSVDTGKHELAVTADFLNQTLSIVDVAKMIDGAKREDALVGTVDLSMYTPGPLAVAVTPDGKTAVVSISGGWLSLATSGIPAGNGTVVFVDLEARKVTGELFTGASPMGIVITKDGTHAFVGQLSDTYISYIDIAARSFTKIQTGNSWNEELALDDTGTTGILSTGTAGDAMTFSVTSMTHGQTAGLTGDAGGVAFFPGTLFAFVVQAPTQLTGNTGGYNVLDVTDPMLPKVTDNVRVMGDTRISYPVTPVPNRKSVVYPSTDTGKLSLLEMGLDSTNKAKAMQTVMVGDASSLAYGITSNADGRVLVSVGTEHYIAVVDLTTAKSVIIPWGTTKVGPLAAAYIPGN